MCAVGVFRGRGALTRAGVACARFGINVLYKLCDLLPRRDEVLFFSRQSNDPSGDFLELGRQFQEKGFAPVFMTKKLSLRSVFSYAAFAVREIYHLARCRVCVVDRYDPVISLVNLRCEDAPVDSAPAASVGGAPAAPAAQAGPSGLPLYDRFPEEPVVVQLWHAFGAFKKFGFQSLGTQESHPVDTARIFRIHRNYSWVLCSGQGARVPFAEAFNLPVDRVVALPRPEYFELIDRAKAPRTCVSKAWSSASDGRGAASTCGAAEVAGGAGVDAPCKAAAAAGVAAVAGTAAAAGATAAAGVAGAVASPALRPRVLVAPTLRKSHETEHPLRDLYASGAWHALESAACVAWSFHPLEEAGVASGDVNELLPDADYVVTDYSSIVYEAYLLGKRVAFYVPDLQQYARTPGLNANPGVLCPDLCFSSVEDLARFLAQVESGALAYPRDQYERFFASAFDACDYDRTCVVDFVLDRLTH